jgi:phage gpG-like protein
MLTATGDFGVVEGWRKLFEDGDEALRLASRSMAEEMLQLTFERFRAENDPYGRRWKPKKRPDGRKTLSGKTSRLKNGWHIVRFGLDGWMIAPSVEYAAYHQKPGTKTVAVHPSRRVQGRSLSDIARTLGITLTEDRTTRPRRMMVPDAERGLPREYQKAMEASAQDALSIYFDGGGSLIPKTSARFSVRDLARRIVRKALVAANG